MRQVVYNGITYTRGNGRWYYEPNGTYLAKGYTSLHRQVYMDAVGQIPDGYHIHHRDHDHDNNAPDNLEALPAREHASYHLARRRQEPGHNERHYRWHRSDEGRQQLRANAAKMRENTPETEYTCRNCGVAGVAKSAQPRVYCSDACQYEWEKRNANLRICPICDKEFGGKRSNVKPVQTCSYQCGWELRRRRAGVQPDG